MSILNDELKKFEYYVKKIPSYLKQSHGVIEQYKIWHNLLTGHDFQPTLDVDAELNAEGAGKMYKYVGQTNETYTYGHIYKINEIRRYQVTYFVNGGIGNVPIDLTEYAPGDTVTVDFTTLPTPVGQNNFIGWSTNAAATLPEFTNDGTTTFEITSDTQLYAIYKPYYLVQYNINGGTGNIPVDNTQYSYGDIVTVKFDTLPIWDGQKDFMGWSFASFANVPEFTSDGTLTFEILENKTLYAVYESYYLLTYSANGGQGSIPTDATHYYYGDTVLVKFISTPTSVGGNPFAGWSFDSEAMTPEFTTDTTTSFAITENTTLYAIYDYAILGVSGLYQSDPTLTRTDDAIGMSWTMTDNEIVSDFDDVFPYNLMQRITINSNVFVRVPKMWWRITYDENNYITDIAVSEGKIIAGTNQVVVKSDEFYYGAYKASYNNSYMLSQSGLDIIRNTGISLCRTDAQRSGGIQVDLYHLRILQFLWLIEFATKNSQSVMNGASTLGHYTGATDDLTSPSGQLDINGRMRWHYIEDFIGNGTEFVDGIYVCAGALGVTSDPSKYTNMNFDAYFTMNDYDDELAAIGIVDMTNPLLAPPVYTVKNQSYNTHFCDRVDASFRPDAIFHYGLSGTTDNPFGLFYMRSRDTSYTTGARLIRTSQS